ncbi:MAG TPA: aminoacyl-tRNA hydrolase [Candidatus Saccharibacteria bacterium]|jgi:PTH1 family peptidyl-tRNA hydrolase|nr:aminoacyl-tRNA hydrolase [Candidatus Saccharibacteria bacterium]
MGLFDRKKTSYYESQPLYTLGNSQTLLVVGLGNAGKQYTQNRHNAGFMTVDRYHDSHDFSDWIEKKDLRCLMAIGDVGSTRVILIKPTTMMNLSGEAVQKVMHFYKLQGADTLVVYDELDIDFGVIRTRNGGSSGGHNGIKSLLAHTDDTFGRIRIGIGPNPPAGGSKKISTANFVLQDFSPEQKEALPKIIREACAMIDERTVGPLADRTVPVL